MDPTTFDRLTRIISASASRRGALTALLAASGARFLSASESTARRRKDRANGRGRRKQKSHKTRTRPATAEAVPGKCCASGNCTPGPGKNLGKCCYEDQNLAGRNFKGANLGRANFSRAILTNANFSSANLDKTCFVDTDVTGARFGGANQGTAIFCRTQTDNGENNAGCAKGTPCCPTCDDAHPCDPDQVCCQGRCVPGNCCDNSAQSTCGTGEICCGHRCIAGDCCAAADCAVQTCQRRACADQRCVYTPVFGAQGPRCTTLCCENEQEQPVCCPDGTTICDPQALCCTAQSRDTTCAVGTPSPKCGEVIDNCGQRVDCGACAVKTCQEGTCTGAASTCEYTPVFGARGPQCPTVCCRDAAGAPECCEAGTTTCTVNERCRCAGDQDCAPGATCCNGACKVRVWTNQAIFGESGRFKPEQLNFPDGVAVAPDGETVWVADAGNNRISIWTKSGSDWIHLTNFGASVFANPEDVAVSSDGKTAWVVDSFHSTISVWAKQSDGSWANQTSFGGLGDGPSQFSIPRAVAVSADETVWVADPQHDRISVWTKSGASWSHQGNFAVSGPAAVAVSADGETVWVAESGPDRIAVWTRSGSTWSLQTTFGSGHLDNPLGVAVSADGKSVWVSDSNHDRISIWVKQGDGSWAHQTTFGSEGSGPSEFKEPLGVDVAPNGLTVWVVDGELARVSVWALVCPAL